MSLHDYITDMADRTTNCKCYRLANGFWVAVMWHGFYGFPWECLVVLNPFSEWNITIFHPLVWPAYTTVCMLGNLFYMHKVLFDRLFSVHIAGGREKFDLQLYYKKIKLPGLNRKQVFISSVMIFTVH